MRSFIHIPLLSLVLLSCKEKSTTKIASANSLDLKKGEIVSCGPQDGEMYGSVSFSATVPAKLRKDFNIAIALLHSFEYDEAEKMFAKVIREVPDCAMAYWGVAMSNFHPLWVPPTPAELHKGIEAIHIAQSIQHKTQRESDYTEAAARFFEHADKFDHRSRVLKFERAMETIYEKYSEDKEAAVFYALALNAAADPTDKTFAKQKKAFNLLNPIFQQEPLHPGIAHYIIHSLDHPELATLALPAARKYAAIAPASAHAQHMPSHIFTNLGLWDECIKSNLVAASSARCYAEKAKIKGHWDEELHALDYLVYAYLQKKQDDLAKQQLDYLESMREVNPVTFKVAYAFAASPARFALERKDWRQAATLQLHPDFPWKNFPWQEGIYHFARVLGNVHLNNLNAAEKELDTLKALYNTLLHAQDKSNEAAQVLVQIKASEAWIAFKKGKNEEALTLMTAAADAEDGMEKHPVTPCAVIPARELLGDMLFQMNHSQAALEAFREDLKLHPNRRNGQEGVSMSMQQLAMRQ